MVSLNKREARTTERSRTISSSKVRFIRRSLLKWWRRSGRRFYWRDGKPSLFNALVTEMLLSKSQAERVDEVGRRVLARWPSPERLARANSLEIEAELYPLGLQTKRARLLRDCAKVLVERHAGVVPDTYEELLSLPYVGTYAANAVLCFALSERRPVVDANVARVYCRLFGLGTPPRELRRAKDLWFLAETVLAPRKFREFNWAVLDLGGTICLPRQPRCDICPVKRMCAAIEAHPKERDSGRRSRQSVPQ
jgi:A/G-specific adenine glycosylase